MSSAGSVAVVDACRVPIGCANEQYRDVRGDDLLALLFRGLVDERLKLDSSLVDEVIVGCGHQAGEQSLNIGRRAWLQAGLAPEVPGYTLDMASGSGQQALHLGLRSILSGTARCVVAGGLDVVTRSVPPRPWYETLGRPGHAGSPELVSRYRIASPVEAAEQIAERWGVPREAMDALGVESHRRAVEATAMGRFESELIHVVLPDGSLVYRDEGMRPDYTMDTAMEFRPILDDGGRITPGHCSQAADGAAAALCCSEEFARANGLPVRARIRHAVTVGGDPVLMLTGAIAATTRLLAEAGVKPRDVSIFEVNEDFASVVLAWQREFAVDLGRINPNGGAIALGQPAGATGTRLLATLLPELERRGGGLGVQAMDASLGLGVALLVEVP